MPERIRQCAAASYATVPPPAFPPPDPECSSGSIGPPDPRPPSDGRDWGETYLADPLLLCSLLPPSDPVFSSVSPLVPPALPSYPAALGPATSPSSISVHSSLQNCYASSRSISFSCDCTLSALITASLTPSVIGDRPSHPIWFRQQSLEKLGVGVRCMELLAPVLAKWEALRPTTLQNLAEDVFRDDAVP